MAVFDIDFEKPVLQVALDFVDIERALQVAREAVDGGADWIEAGTPLIKSEGLDSVRALRKEFPDKIIIADMKTMDAGRAEVEVAAKAGADIIDVLGAASDATIAECVEAANNYGARIVVDLIEVADPVSRAVRAADVGAHYISVHTAIDVQMRGGSPFRTLEEVAKSVSIPVGVAGGINSETASKAIDHGARILIVGGAITKSADAAKASRLIKKAMSTGKMIDTELYKRAVTDDEIKKILLKVSTANVSDAMHRADHMKGIRPVMPGMKVAGRAVTVRTYPGDWAKPVEAIDVADKDEVIVIDAAGKGPGLWGELATHSALVKGIAGTIVEGAVRDTVEIMDLKYPVFSKLVCPNAGEPKGFGEINVPITVGGIKVFPGDWIVADDDGVMCIPASKSSEIANRAMDVLEKENRLREEIQRGKTLSQVAYLEKWEKKK